MRQQFASTHQIAEKFNGSEHTLAHCSGKIARELRLPPSDLPGIVRTVKYLVDKLNAGMQSILAVLAAENAGANPKERRSVIRPNLQRIEATQLVSICTGLIVETKIRVQAGDYIQRLATILVSPAGDDTPHKLAEGAIAYSQTLDWLRVIAGSSSRRSVE